MRRCSTSFTNHLGNAIQNHNGISPHTYQNGYYQKDNQCWQGCREKATLVHCQWECKLMQLLWKTVWRFLKKLKIELPNNPVIQLLGIYLKKMKTLIRKHICTPMFIAALFTITKIQKQPKCPSIDEWIKKM